MSDENQDIKNAIDYAIRSNAQESIITTEETLVMLEQVRNGEITFGNMLQSIDFKARFLRRGMTISLLEALEAVKMTQK